MGQILRCGRFRLTLDRPLIMGVLNVTPDSFAEAAPSTQLEVVLERAHQMIAQGADLIDIGGESTRPGALPVPEEEEAARVLPVLEALRDTGVPLSVDTSRPRLMRRALDSGADLINDITGFRDPQAIAAVAAADCALCIMHMQGEPRTMQQCPQYDDVALDVKAFLRNRCDAVLAAGVAPGRILIDPGFGFGKTQSQNYELLRRLPEARAGDFPWLIGVSRKSMIGHVTGRIPVERVAGSIAAALAAVARGAAMVRVHDVAATRDALRVWQAVEHGVKDG